MKFIIRGESWKYSGDKFKIMSLVIKILNVSAKFEASVAKILEEA